MDRHCEEQRDEAIQSAAAETDWIASLSLAMTAERVLHARHAQIARRAKVTQTFLLRRRANQNHAPARPAPTRGAFRDRHGRWERDAMDAACCRTNNTSRTAKSCGPGAPRLALSFADARRRWQQSPVTGEITYKP